MQGLLYTASGDQKMIDVRDYAHAREILNSDNVKYIIYDDDRVFLIDDDANDKNLKFNLKVSMLIKNPLAGDSILVGKDILYTIRNKE